jgi:hypothetical protein
MVKRERIRLRPVIRKKLKEIQRPVDIVVGVMTKDVETTIVHVLNVVSEGLYQHFGDYSSLVVVCDGFSRDRTRAMAELFELHNGLQKIVTEDAVKGGKGGGIATVFQIAESVDAKAVALLDGDLLSVRPSWVQALLQPVLYGRADLVVPYYVRHKYDGVITNNLAYPFTRALYGMDVRQPIGGEFGFSIPLVKILLHHPIFPLDFGIDIFMTTVAAAEDLNIHESMLGLKIHESTTKYADPSVLLTMFRQVVRTMFDLAIHYDPSTMKGPREKRNREKGEYFGPKPVPVTVSIEKFLLSFGEEYPHYRDLYREFLSRGDFEELDRVAEERPLVMTSRLWSRAVYSLFEGYRKREGTEKRREILDALRVLWLGRFVGYVLETEGMETNEAEKVLQAQAEIFEMEFPYLLERILTDSGSGKG